jgi:hypothetical protein
MAHSMSLSLDLSDRLLASQREIRYLRTRLTDTEDTGIPDFMPKSSTHCMHDPRSIVPHIWPKVLIDNQMS